MNYPLPWCDALDKPYWEVNLAFCSQVPGWRERQSNKPMQEIIPWIDDMIAMRETKT